MEENKETIEQQQSEQNETKVDAQQVIKDFMSSKEFIDLINAEKGKAVKAFKDEKMPEYVNKEIEARNHKQPWQIEIEDLNRKMTVMEQEKAKEIEARLLGENKNDAIKALSEKNLPVELADFIASTDSDKTKTNVNTLVEILSNLVTKTKQGLIDQNNITVPNKTNTSELNKPGPNASKAEHMAYLKQQRQNK